MGFCPKDQKSLETGEQTQVTQVRVSDCSLRLLATVPCCLTVVLTLPNHVQADRQKPLKSQPSHPELRPSLSVCGRKASVRLAEAQPVSFPVLSKTPQPPSGDQSVTKVDI